MLVIVEFQFTPDLLPADVIGTQIYSQKDEAFHVKKGPVFANFVLADEINRAPAKVQSALLEAMQEHQVTIGETTFELPNPFPCYGNSEPNRAGGNLYAARSTSRPLYVKGCYRLSYDRRGETCYT